MGPCGSPRNGDIRYKMEGICAGDLTANSRKSTAAVENIPHRDFLPEPLKASGQSVIRGWWRKPQVEKILTRASQRVGLLYVTPFHVKGVLSHRRRQSCSGLSLMSMTQASIRRVPDPGCMQPLKLDVNMSGVERFTITLCP